VDLEENSETPFIKYEVGNGRDIFVCLDNWYSMLSLEKRVGTRIVYDAVSNLQAKLSDFIREGRWYFPPPISHELQMVQANLPVISSGTVDRVVWTLHNSGKYTSSTAKEAFREHRDQVAWRNLVWFKGYIPKYALILWMVCKGKLLTRDKLKRWGCINDDICVLCGSVSESLDHLFFQCGFAKSLWTVVKWRNGITRSNSNWEEEAVNAIKEAKGGSFEARIRSLAIAATVYLIWQERNSRIFKDARHNWEYVLDRVNESIKDASWNWRAERNYRNWTLCKHWGLYDQIILVYYRLGSERFCCFLGYCSL